MSMMYLMLSEHDITDAQCVTGDKDLGVDGDER